jgi:hypothetical protein
VATVRGYYEYLHDKELGNLDEIGKFLEKPLKLTQEDTQKLNGSLTTKTTELVIKNKNKQTNKKQKNTSHKGKSKELDVVTQASEFSTQKGESGW